MKVLKLVRLESYSHVQFDKPMNRGECARVDDSLGETLLRKGREDGEGELQSYFDEMPKGTTCRYDYTTKDGDKAESTRKPKAVAAPVAEEPEETDEEDTGEEPEEESTLGVSPQKTARPVAKQAKAVARPVAKGQRAKPR